MKMFCLLSTATVLLLSIGNGNAFRSYEVIFPPDDHRNTIFFNETIQYELDSFTICIWAKPSNLADERTMFTYTTGPRDILMFQLYLKTFFLWIDNYWYEGQIPGELPVQIGKYIHLCAAWENQNGNLDFYYNGEVTGHWTDVKPKFTISPHHTAILGNRHPSSSYNLRRSWRGALAEFQMWDYYLSTRMIKQLSICQTEEEGNIFSWWDSLETLEIPASVSVNPIVLCRCGS